jgi:phosphopentomutase
MTNSKELELLEKIVDRLQNRVDKIEEKLAQIQINDVIIKGREILKIYERLHLSGVLDIYKISDELFQIKQIVRQIQYHPWEWLERDPVAQKAFMTKLEKRIAEEVKQASLFTIYQENPQVVVKIVKDVVKEYLDIWEVNDQIARQIVDNVIKNGYMMELAKQLTQLVMTPEFRLTFLQSVVDMDELRRVKRLMEEEG